MRYMVMFLAVVSTLFSKELTFKEVHLENFVLYGIPKHVVYKTKEERNSKINKLWKKFLSSRRVDLKQSSDDKIYMIYSNYKTNSFDCFLGIKSKKKQIRLSQKTVQKSQYYKGTLLYKKGMDMDKLWEKISQQKRKRNFKNDVEVYEINALSQKEQRIKLYLSK